VTENHARGGGATCAISAGPPAVAGAAAENLTFSLPEFEFAKEKLRRGGSLPNEVSRSKHRRSPALFAVSKNKRRP
jgi:hypothetical protein